jgi:hypothetical protein
MSAAHPSVAARLLFNGPQGTKEQSINQELISEDQQVSQTPTPVLLIIGANEDRNTILAALRFYQERGMGEPDNRSDAIHDIATNGGEDISYDDGDIDDLCERVNSVPSDFSLEEVSTADLFREIARREALTGLHGAIGALCDELERQGFVSGGSPMFTYLAYRLKREEMLVAGLPKGDLAAQGWQLKIDQMGPGRA